MFFLLAIVVFIIIITLLIVITSAIYNKPRECSKCGSKNIITISGGGTVGPVIHKCQACGNVD